MRTLGGLCAIFVGIQFIRPELNNPPTTADLQAIPEVKQILQNSCYSCHSNQTRLAWFDEVAPAYWIVTHDVEEGRKHLNFSEIGKLPGAQQTAILFEAVDQIELDAMPPPAYRHVHPGSVVTPEQLAVLKRYLNPATLIKQLRLLIEAPPMRNMTSGFRQTAHRSMCIPRPMGLHLCRITKTGRRSAAPSGLTIRA
jgi:hypothetical protein